MGIVSTFLRSATLENPDTTIGEALTGGSLLSTESVTPNNAIKNTAVLNAVSLISEQIASLPLKLYRRLDRGKEEAIDLPLYRTLHMSPNPEQNKFTFWETGTLHLLFWGNFYAQIDRAANGQRIDLWPIHPARVEVKRTDGDMIFEVEDFTDSGNGMRKTKKKLSRAEMFHIPGLSFNGRVGFSPIRKAARSLGISMAAEKHTARFYDNDASPGGVLVHPGNLGEDAINRIRQSWNERHQGPDKAHRITVLEEDMSYERVGISAEDAQLLESRQFQVEEVARIFNVPPHKLKDLENATFSNIEEQNLEFVIDTLRPWLVRIEQAINNQLVFSRRQSEIFAEHVIEGLLRGDTESRAEFYQKMLMHGIMTPNEIREKENMNPYEGGDRHFIPANLLENGDGPLPPPASRNQNEETIYHYQGNRISYRERVGLVESFELDMEPSEIRALGYLAADFAASEVLSDVDREEYRDWFEGYLESYQQREDKSERYESLRLVNASSKWSFDQSGVENHRVKPCNPSAPCHDPDEARDILHSPDGYDHPPFDDRCSCLLIPT